jgi:hypothetical protein
MSTTITHDRPMADDTLMHDVRVLYAERNHRLRQDLNIRLTEVSALNMRAYLRGRPFKGLPGNGVPVQHVPHPDGGTHCQPARPAAPARQPVRDIGYFEHDGRLYKVVKSVYGANPGRMYAKVLSTEAGDWVMAKGMLGQLSETERIDPSAGSALGRLLASDPGSALYGHCWICKRPLTDENSLREGKGPGPHVGYGD